MKRHEKPRSLLQLAQQVEDRRLHRDVERGDGLVGDEQRRRHRQRAREADALALSAGELVRIAVPQLRPQADVVEELAHAPVERSPRAASRWMRSGSPTISPQVMRGLSDEYGSWKTMCISRRSGRSSRRDVCVMSRPLRRIVPDVGSCRRTTQLPTVDLPLPDSPTSPSISPAPIVNDTSSTAWTTAAAAEHLRPGVEVLDEVLDLECRDGVAQFGPGWKQATRWSARDLPQRRHLAARLRRRRAGSGQRTRRRSTGPSSDGTRPGISRSLPF